MEGKQNIKDLCFESLTAAVKAMGLKPYVASQIIQWIYKKGARSFEEMTNISKTARDMLSAKFYISSLELVKTLESADGTKKFAWRLKDGNVIESVLIPSEPYSKVPFPKDLRTYAPMHLRTTLCISTQVGCAMGCKFCRTAGMGHIRNLTQGEILDQVLAVPKVTNVVLMGMGEPLANYDNVVGAVRIMTNTKGLCLSKRHVTLSTCGLVPGIEKLAKEKLGIKLAVSLNATTDEARSEIMPVNKKYPLAELFKALKKYAAAEKPVGRLTFEYVVIEGKNDTIEDAKRLVRFMSNIPSKVNLIPLNKPFTTSPLPRKGAMPHRGFSPSWEGSGGGGDAESSIQRFAQYLRNKNIQVNIRQSRGADILAACGQLAAG